jgi:N-formylmaleamate deformylase
MAPGARGHHRTVNGVRLHYLEHGTEGPPLVLLPGITSPAITWAFVSERLAAFSHVFTLDNRGRGLSSGGPDLGYRLADYAADTAGLIAALGLDRPIVLGHSMGARIAVSLAATSPQAVGPLILADPPVSGPGRRPYPLPLPWYLDGIDKASRGEKMQVAGTPLANWSEDQLALRAEWLPTCDKTAIAESHRSFGDEDIHALMPSIRSRTLLVCAENGGTITAEEEREIVGLIPGCRSVRIPKVGHMMPWDDLEAFVRAVREFVA